MTTTEILLYFLGLLGIITTIIAGFAFKQTSLRDDGSASSDSSSADRRDTF